MDIQRGHIYFAIGFIIVFAVIIAWMYRKDIGLHKKYYKNSWVVLLAVAVAIAIFLYLKGRLIHF